MGAVTPVVEERPAVAPVVMAESMPESDEPRTTVALAGDTMLGRGVAHQISEGVAATSLVDEDVAALMREADACLLNLECCISTRGEMWAAPGKPYFFRAPPEAVELLVHLGVDCVTLANNHALDYGVDALVDTLHHLEEVGIRVVGAGADETAARTPAQVAAGALSVGVAAFTDHPRDFAAAAGRPGVAFADIEGGVPAWLTDLVESLAADVDCVLVTPHWGPNMVTEPLAGARRAADRLVSAGASVLAGHSAHVFHGVGGFIRAGEPAAVLYDLGDFLDDYAVDPDLRNDLGLLFLLTLTRRGPQRLEALPLRLDYCRTVPAGGEDASWVCERFRAACASLGTDVEGSDGRLVVTFE